MTAISKTQTTQASFQLKTNRITHMTMELHRFDKNLLKEQIENIISKAPLFFKHAPLILSLQQYKDTLTTEKLAYLTETCKKYDIFLFAIKGGDAEIQNIAKQAGLFTLPCDSESSSNNYLVSQKTEPVNQYIDEINTTTLQDDNKSELYELDLTNEEPFYRDLLEEETIRPLQSKTSDQVSDLLKQHNGIAPLFISEPVRSGQQIYHQGELVIISSVSAGAELVSESNIHVYGTLRGKALAGVNGNDKARIFCSCFRAELVSVNGHYKTSSNFSTDQIGQNVQVWLSGGSLKITPLT